MIRKLFTLLLLLPLTALSADIKVITGEATYYGENSDSPASCRQKALEAARIQALAAEFGTVLSQVQESREVTGGKGGEISYFSSLSAAEVRGEWIADVGEPKFDTSFDSDGNLVVKCTVKIQARALSNKAVDFDAIVLRNGLDDRHADTSFRSGDDLFVRFRAPRDGYVAIYLVGEDRSVTAMLPYLSSVTGQTRVRRDRDYYIFSSAQADKELGVPDEFCVVTDAPVEHNQLYVLYSPNEFTRAADHAGGDNMPRTLSYAEFTRWLSKVHHADEEMGKKVFNIVITNPNF